MLEYCEESEACVKAFADHLCAVAEGDPDRAALARYELLQHGWQVERKGGEPIAAKGMLNPDTFMPLVLFNIAIDAHATGDDEACVDYLGRIRGHGWDISPASDDAVIETYKVETAFAFHLTAVAHGDPDAIVETRYDLRQLGWHVAEIEGRLRERNDVLPVADEFIAPAGLFLNAIARHVGGDPESCGQYLEALRAIGWDVRPLREGEE